MGQSGLMHNHRKMRRTVKETDEKIKEKKKRRNKKKKLKEIKNNCKKRNGR